MKQETRQETLYFQMKKLISWSSFFSYISKAKWSKHGSKQVEVRYSYFSKVHTHK